MNLTPQKIEKLLLNDDKIIYCDEVKGLKKEERVNQIRVLDETVETPNIMTPQEYLDSCNLCLTKAIESGKITKNDLNPEYYKSSSRQL